MRRLLVFASTILLVTRVAAQPPRPAPSAPDSTQSVAVLRGLLAGMRAGSTLMVRLTDGSSFEGDLVPSHGLELLRPGSLDSVTVDLGSVDTLWEERISKRKGMTVGGVIGGVVGAAALTYLAFLWDDPGTRHSGVSDAEIATVTILFGGAVGTTTGAIIGGVTSSGSPTWTQRYPTDRVRPSPWTHHAATFHQEPAAKTYLVSNAPLWRRSDRTPASTVPWSGSRDFPVLGGGLALTRCGESRWRNAFRHDR